MKREVSSLRISAERKEEKDEVAVESPLSIFVNGKHFATAMISPSLEKEFVFGLLFTEGVINGSDEIFSFRKEGNIARVLLRKSHFFHRKFIFSGCGGSDFLKKIPEIDSDFIIKKDDVHRGIRQISSSPLYKSTRGVHSCGLLNGKKFVAQDIGRHNALDKVIGSALIKKIDFKKRWVATTGRISSDMVMKCGVAGIPIIASKGAVTSLAIQMGKDIGLTVIGFVRGKGMNIYAGEERIG